MPHLVSWTSYRKKFTKKSGILIQETKEKREKSGTGKSMLGTETLEGDRQSLHKRREKNMRKRKARWRKARVEMLPLTRKQRKKAGEGSKQSSQRRREIKEE